MRSSAFKEGKPIPAVYSCDGRDISPPLAWDAPPTATVSLALIVDDPDAPGRTWVHWLLYNLPSDTWELPENMPKAKELRNGARQGMNDFKAIGYNGPCPPPPHGAHRYFFKLYALDQKLTLEPGATKSQVEKAMAGHILATGRLIGTYDR